MKILKKDEDAVAQM